MPKRSRKVSFALMPIAIILWVIGWTLFFTGSRQKAIKQKLAINREPTFLISVPEPKIITQQN
jgi:hypothetical protein